MSHWNYRITKDAHSEGEAVYGLREVHYDDAGGIEGWTEEFATPTGESPAELIRDLLHMVHDARHGVLDLETRELTLADARADSDRVEDVLDALRVAWQRQPALRLTQVIANAALQSRPESAMPELYYLEDDELIDALGGHTSS